MANFFHKYLWPGLLALVLTFTGCTGMLYLAQTANAAPIKKKTSNYVDVQEVRRLAALRRLTPIIGYTIPTFYTEADRTAYINKIDCLIKWANTLYDKRDQAAYLYWLTDYAHNARRSTVEPSERTAEFDKKYRESERILGGMPAPPAPCPRVKQ